LARMGARPRRSVELALYSGEELGLYGSTGHARAHLGDHAAVVVYDEGSTKMTGYALNGLQDLRAPVDAALKPVAHLGPFVHSLQIIANMDSFSSHREGVPTLAALQLWEPYAVDYHAETDTFDKVDLKSLKVNAVIAGATVWGLANDPKLPAPRHKRDAGADR